VVAGNVGTLGSGMKVQILDADRTGNGGPGAGGAGAGAARGTRPRAKQPS
jgi:hypothetical protein